MLHIHHNDNYVRRLLSAILQPIMATATATVSIISTLFLICYSYRYCYSQYH
jgi:hypothetical protein